MATLKKDDNYISVSGGITDDSNQTVQSLRVNPATNRLIVDATTSSSDIPTASYIYNVAMTNANTEYSKSLPANTKKLMIKLRALNANLKFCFTANESGGTFFTVPYGATAVIDNINISAGTVYMQSPTAGQTCEIIAWI